jgi:hypothetical protein
MVAGKEGKDEASRGCCRGAGEGKEWERWTAEGITLDEVLEEDER